MPKVDVVNEVPIARSFRVDQAAGMFDVSLEDKSRVRIRGEVPGVDEDWTLGAIIGPSGSGKGTVARTVYGADFLEQLPERSSPFDWDRDAAIVDGFGDDADLRQVTALLGSVGLASPPAWVRPYRVLSTGQRFRADLARALMLDRELVVFDEFGGTVSEDVANVCAATVAKSVRKGRGKVKRFVAVGARDNFVDWLDPEWVLDMRTEPGRLTWRARGSVRRGRGERGGSAPGKPGRPGGGRPGIEFGVWRGSRSAWPLFRGHHYLSSRLNKSARVYLARVRLPGREDWETVGFCATLNNAGFKGYRMVHRLVVLPDWQGLGLGPRLLDRVAEVEAVTGPVSIRTSHPGLIGYLDRSERWRFHSQYDGTAPQRGFKNAGSFGRVTAGFMWRG
jgi:GNAT superfamily N-acetyltransferase